VHEIQAVATNAQTGINLQMKIIKISGAIQCLLVLAAVALWVPGCATL
jgi:hypothetical protein